ncbi:uncharacterized protein V1516DRAFT_685847 [Lipomyces oligophaga]|uniref:uncharacterized protein n=1 Tax=Lipomyces oligophaga TaxID=45792 RepID=UPI0034D018E3
MASVDHHRSYPFPFSSSASSFLRSSHADYSPSTPLNSRGRPVSEIIFLPSSSTPSKSSVGTSGSVNSDSVRPGFPIRSHSSSLLGLRQQGIDDFSSGTNLSDRNDDSDNVRATGLDDHPELMSVIGGRWLSDIDHYDGSLETLASSSTSSQSSSSSTPSSTSSAVAANNAATSINLQGLTGNDHSSASFKLQLGSIENWFSCVLSEPERTVALYTLLQHTSEAQVKFLISVLRQMECQNNDSTEQSSVTSTSNGTLTPGDRRSTAFLSAPLHESFTADIFETDQLFLQQQQKQERQVSDKHTDRSDRAISPIGSEKSASRPASVDFDQHSLLSSTPIVSPNTAAATQTPVSAAYKYPFSSPVTSNWASMIGSANGSNAVGSSTSPSLPPPSSTLSGTALQSNTSTSSLMNADIVANAEIVANATALKMAALSTVNNRLMLDSDMRKLRRRNNNNNNNSSSNSSGILDQCSSPVTGSPLMYNEAGQVVPVPMGYSAPPQLSPLQSSIPPASFMSPSPVNSNSLSSMQSQSMGSMSASMPTQSGTPPGTSPFSAGAIRNRRAAYQMKFESQFGQSSPFSSPLARSPMQAQGSTNSPASQLSSTIGSKMPSSLSNVSTISRDNAIKQQQHPSTPARASPGPQQMVSGLTSFMTGHGLGLTAEMSASPSPSFSTDWYNNPLASPSVMMQFASQLSSTPRLQSQSSLSTPSTSMNTHASKALGSLGSTNLNSPSPAPVLSRVSSSNSVVGSGASTPKKSILNEQGTPGSPVSGITVPDDALLNDIPAWLRSLRLHKYTDNLKAIAWQDLVRLSEDQLGEKGVSALGARRKMLKVFEVVKEVKAMEIREYDESLKLKTNL